MGAIEGTLWTARQQHDGEGVFHVIKKLRKLAFRFGYDFTLRRLPQLDTKRRMLGVPRDMEPEFVDFYEASREFTMTSVERMHSIYQGVRHVISQGIEGDFVECGVWRGGSCMRMARTLVALGETSRRIHLFDTFAGMTKPDDIDRRSRDGAEMISRWEHFQREDHNGWTFASLDEVKANLATTGYPVENLVYVKGEVESTLPHAAPERIALLRLDTDWYQSTYHELVHLWPRMAPGSALLLDDYGSFDGARKAVDQYLEENHIGLFLHRVDSTGRIALKPMETP